MILLAQTATLTLPAWLGPILGTGLLAFVAWLITRQIGQIDRRQDECDERATVLREEVATLRVQAAELHKDVERLDERFEGIDERLSEGARHFETIDKRLNGPDGKPS